MREAIEANSEILAILPGDSDATLYRGLLSFPIGDFQSAEDSFQAVLRTAAASDGRKYVAHFLLFAVLCGRADDARAAEHWQALSAIPYAEEASPIFVPLLTALAQNGRGKFLLETIANSAWAEPLAPFLRALEYIETGNRDLIEKLSPEVRTVVEDLVAHLQEKRAGTSAPALPQTTSD